MWVMHHNHLAALSPAGLVGKDLVSNHGSVTGKRVGSERVRTVILFWTTSLVAAVCVFFLPQVNIKL